MLNDLPAVLRTMEVDACELTPTVAGSLLRKRENAPGLKVLLTIGEMLNAPVVEEFGGDDAKESMLWAMYGPTEATIHCTLQTAFATDSSTGNIGVPLDTVSCFIVEEADSEASEPQFKVLPQGEIGELAVGGYQLATGYINRPEQTSSVFIQTQYGRVYRTGDKARLRSDGVLECLGRISDGQVKLRGQRLELGEVEQAVLRTSGCHSAVAAVVKSILVVFCAVDAGVTEEGILEKCKDWLPQYMVPGEVVLMDEFPRLPSGKVDRKKMTADYEQRRTESSEGSHDLEPTDELEATIIGIVSDALNFKANRSTSLASAGLDSLRAIKLASALRECDLNLNSASLLSMKSVADIVFAIRRQPAAKSPNHAFNQTSLSAELSSVLAQNPAVQDIKELIEDVIPCTPLQLAMLAETTQESTSYCNQIELEAPQGYTAQQIHTAFVELAQRNEILRVGFATLQSRFVSVLFKELRVGQINIVEEIERGFAISEPPEYIDPLRIQIARESATTGPRVLVQLHHAIYDGWSMDIILSDLSTLLSKGSVAPRPPFRDVVKFYNGPENQVDDDAARVFWTEHLVGWNKVPFPKLNPRVGESSAISLTRTQLAVPKQKVVDLIQSVGCSTQVIFQAALALLWSGIIGVQDVLIGSVTSGRTIPVAGVERIVGPCIASLPLRVDLSTVTANLDLLNSIQSSNRKAMQHCMLPLGEIRKLAGLQPGESLYDILFAYQESLDSSARTGNVLKETSHLDRLETPVLFEVEPTLDGFTLQVTHRLDFVPSALITHAVEQFEAICLNILENSTKAVQAIQRNINVSLSSHNTAPDISGVTSDLSKGFEEVALENPTLSALCFAQQLSGQRKLTTMSFQELNCSANQLGRHIRYQGARIGDVVAIIMDKSPTLYVSILAILKAGCAYLPILPSTPAVRIQAILKQAKAKYCLVDDASSPAVPRAPRTRWINVDSAPLSNQSRDNLNTPTDGSRLAYVIYTSGTTGSPKGVAVKQQNIMSNLSTLRSAYPAGSKSQRRFLQACSQAFDVSVFEIFYAWHMGMCLCTGMNDTLFEDLEQSIRDLDVTHLSMTPTVASLVDPQNVPSVEFLVTAGERLSKSVLQSWHEKLWQGYGPSELTNICTVKKMASGDTVEHLGHALPNTSTFVLFPSSLDISPIGWVGELCFGGSQVAQGYLNMPGLTGEKFVEHPQYGRLYRTGDLGRMLNDGSIMFLDRLDGQIKLRGQRIEASEINSVATSAGFGSSAATVLARRERTAAEQLVLFYVPEKGHSDFCEMEVDVEKHRSLFALLQSRLPAYMVPSYLVPVSMIPLIPSGKVDQRALRACFEHLGQQYLETVSGSLQDLHDDGDWTSMESIVAATISHSTKSPREDVGRWTPLTMLGVDSISAIHLGRELGRQLKRRVAVSDILQHPTVAQLARHLSQNTQSQDETRPVEFFPSTFIDTVTKAFAEQGKTVESVLPCMPLQEAMLSRGQRSYYNKVLLRLHIDPKVIRSFWKIMVERHDILRTCFVTTPDSQKAIAQVVLKEWDIPWMNLDVTEPSFDGAVQKHLKTLPDPIDSQTPPASLALLRYRGSLFLSFISHHALYDATAMERLLKEVEALARHVKLPPPASYKQFLRTALELPGDVEQFWLGHFHGYRPSSLFAAMTNEMDQCTHTTSLDLPLTVLQARTRSLGTSLLSVCQASWANVLSMAHGRHDVCFGNVVGGRTLNMEGLDRLVAPCFNSIPVRVDFSPNWSNIEMAKYLQKLNTDLLAYQFTPLRLIQRKVSRTGRHLFETLLLVQTPLQDIDSGVWTLEEDSGEMDIPLVCEVVPCPSLNSLVINIHRDMNIVTDDVATALAEAFKLLLKATLTSPHATLMDRKHLPTTISSGLSSLKPRQERAEANTHFQESEEDWNEIETKVRQILSQLSSIPESQIRRCTTIFQLGLDSINAVQIASILRQEGFSVSASDVIECPTTSKIASKLQENYAKKNPESHQTYDFYQFSSQVASDVSILPADAKVEAILPCTPVQSAMIASFLQSHGGHYLNAVRYKVDQSVGIEELKTAWGSLQASHPMLRTGFVPVNHNDASFAMVRYHPGSTSLPLEILRVSQNNEIHLFEHKSEMARSIQGSLRLPPWKVVLVDRDGQLSMNLIIHHALYDAPSLHVMLEELSRLLKGHKSRSLPPIEPALSTILCKSLGERAEEKKFWEAKAGQAVVNKFPVMTPLRIENRVVRSDVITSSLSFSKLQQATQASNISIQAAIQAAWTRVLASYLGESSVVFGVALSGRITDETRGAPFPCLNTIPIVASNDPSNSILVKYMMDYNQHLHKYQFSPLGKVQKWLGHPVGTVFDTLIAYQKMDTAESVSIPWEVEADEAMVEYPVSLEIEPVSNDQVRLCITYFSDFLPQEQAQILVEQFDLSLAHIACNPTGQEDDTYHTASHLYSILPAVSSTLNPPVQLLHQFVETGALSHPEKIALEFVSGFNGETPAKQAWTYKEYDCLGNKVANILRDQAAPGSIVAIHFDKCPEAYFSILDPNLLGFEVDCNVVTIHTTSLEALEAPQSIRTQDISPSDTCYCLYTSGTTGTPKGCEITHNNAVEAMMAFQELFKGHWDTNSRWLQFAALHFDVSVLEQYWSWSVGIAVVAAPKDLILDDLTASINRLDITHIDLTPSLARLTHPDEVPSLCRGVFITGGEQLKQEILDVWGPKAVIYNAYGPTEATIGVTMYQRVPVNGRPSNIGPQFPNVGSYIFRQGTEIPVIRGGVGELCVSGKLVGKGYLNRPELTEERFPTLKEFGEKIYRTGDLVRVLFDGCFDFLGRADDQVKLRGQRLEIAEINHAIRAGVDEIHDTATIVARHGTSGKDVLVSFVVGRAAKHHTLQVLTDDEGLGMKAKEACRTRLPGYMVPTYIFSLPYIPLSSNNKAEVKELKKLFGELSPESLVELSRASTKPVSTAAIKTMTTLIEGIAEFSNVNPKDLTSSTSIFDVGVDSITALRLCALLKSRGLKAASPAALLKHPIVGDLANSLAQTSTVQQDKLIRETKQSIQACGHRYRGAVARALGVKATTIEYIAPCSPLQQGIISRTMTSHQGDAYFNTFELELANTTSVESLRASWDQLVQSEAILRTAFVPTTNGFVQVALRDVSIPWEAHTLETHEHLEAFLEEKRQDWIQQNTSTIATPLRLIYLTTPLSRRVVIQIFHALYDGNSFDIMMQRLLENYEGEEPHSGPSFLEALTHGPLMRYDSCKGFWEEHLLGWFFTPVPQLGQHQQGKFAVTATREVSAKPLEQVRSSQNVTLQAVSLSLWAAVLKNYISSSATIGVIVSGRALDLNNVEHTVGPLFNTVPFHSKVLQKQTWSSLIRQCHEFNTAVLEFQHVPLNTVQKWCSGGKPLFDNLFAFQIETPKDDRSLPWETIDSHGSPDYPLALEVVYSRNGSLRFTVVGQGHMVTPIKLDELLDQLEGYIAIMGESTDSEVPVGTGHQIMANQEAMDNAPIWAEKFEDFQWTEEALVLRHEIALLADISSQDVSATVTVLELGLDSIEVIQLSAKLKRRQVIITPSQIMRCQSIARIIKEFEKSVSTDAKVVNAMDSLQATQLKLWRHLENLDVRMDAIESVLPPTPLQESMVAGMIQSDFESYYNHDILEISESVDAKVLRDAWQKVVNCSPILRTSFFEIDSHDLDMTYCQVVSKPMELGIRNVRLEQFDDLTHIISKATERARDGKAHNALFQLTFATLGSRQFVILSMAHALYDGWSLSLLFQDLQATYHGEETVRSAPNSFLSKIASVEGSDAKDFWSQYLEGATPTLLPHRETPGVDRAPSMEKREQVSALPLSEIASFCRQQSISLQVLCQACWAIMLAQQMQTLDVTFGIVVSGRDFDDAQNLMFPTMNTVALRCVLYGSPSSFLRYLEENMGDIREFQNYPLRKAQLAANVNGQGLFNTLFILQKSPEDQTADPMFKSVGGSSATEYPVCVEAEAVADSLVWRVACQSNYCLTEGPDAFIGHLEAIMQFLMTSNASDILSFEEQGVSICGMPPITLEDDVSIELEGTAVKDDPVNTVWDATSSEIRETLHQVSGVPLASIKASDNLYNLGLDSISAIKVASLLRKKGVNLRPQDLIRATNIPRMAEMVSTALQSSTNTSASLNAWVPPQDIPIDNLLERFGVSKDQVELLPALPMQVYMLSAWENAEGCVFYPEFPCLIDGVAELEAIQAAWDRLVAETPLLRTCFIATQSTELPFLQVILKDHRILVRSATRGIKATDRLQPLVRAQIAQNNNDTWTFRLTLHHALYDGVSLPALLHRLSEFLGGAAVKADSGIHRWRQFTIGQASDKAREARRVFWTEYLQGVTPMLAKTPSIDVHERVSYLEKSALSDLAGIRNIAARSGISIQALFLAAYAKVLASKEKATSVVFGIYLANRAAGYDLPLVYPTLNLVPLRVDVPVNWSLVGVARAIQRDIHLIASEGRADVGLWEISNWVGVKITSFVNFLSLPDTPEASGEQVKLIPDGGAGDSGDGPALLAAYRQYQNNMVRDHFSMALDIEVSVQESGLDIGVFGSRQQVSADEAAGLVLKIASVLNEFSI
ncbi:hypothetical protein B0J13DRAFT_530084 [Dactylonectria estremocensis]|uniref:Carrier domain-containing protein n=1 Tax=Dactylonectria estremocensis TaxID=1079267 RepID=A0A9P9E342_9HYPO|nr:hypothetical protein B0J13DRAFT_530084 [Dactylonectria estremocensis]